MHKRSLSVSLLGEISGDFRKLLRASLYQLVYQNPLQKIVFLQPGTQATFGFLRFCEDFQDFLRFFETFGTFEDCQGFFENVRDFWTGFPVFLTHHHHHEVICIISLNDLTQRYPL